MTTDHDTSPMVFVRDHLPRDLQFDRPPDTPSSPVQYIENLRARFEDMQNLTPDRINLRSEVKKIRYRTKANGLGVKVYSLIEFRPTKQFALT